MQEKSIRNYLFSTKSGRIEFVIIETEFSQLNDYCVLSLSETFKKLEELKSDLLELKSSGKRVIEPDYGDLTSDIIWVIEDIEIPTWDDNYRFVAKAMCFVLLSIFTEKSLKSLCDAFTPKKINARLPRGGLSKINLYLKFLIEECSFIIIEPQEFKEVRENCRKIRNAFAHGDWDDVRNEVDATGLVSSFKSVANLFELIEDAVYPGG